MFSVDFSALECHVIDVIQGTPLVSSIYDRLYVCP